MTITIKVKSSGGEVAFVATNSYSNREELKSRGYFFARRGNPFYCDYIDYTLQATCAWIKIIKGEDFLQQAKQEVVELSNMGINLKKGMEY